jgi:hypothetical protein
VKARTLHTAAENGVSSGSINEPAIKSLLNEYLVREGHSASLVDELFTGMVERVVAIVSRIQGTFEFEVQPLREYFAARHLYETAPYSPPGSEQPGTKPERFEALVRNFYWLNVLRFFCECFSRGELSSLADGLDELARSNGYELLAHPRTLSIMLLSDWVFSQQPLTVKRVVEALFEQPGFKIFLSTLSQARASLAAVLPERCGREHLVAGAYRSLTAVRSDEDRASLLSLVRTNSSKDERLQRWFAEKRIEGNCSQWLSDGLRLGLFQTMPAETINNLVSENHEQMLTPLARSGRFDIICSNAQLFRQALDGVLDGDREISVTPAQREGITKLEAFAAAISVYMYRGLLSKSQSGIARRRMMRYGLFRTNVTNAKEMDVCEKENKLIADVLKAVESQSEIESTVWATSLDPWSKIVQTGVGAFGPRWAFKKLAVLASGVRSTDGSRIWEEGAWAGDGNVCENMRFARLRSGNTEWWRDQILMQFGNAEDKMLAGLMFITWATPRAIATLSAEASEFLDSFSESEWRKVHDGLLEALWSLEEVRKPADSGPPIPGGASPKLYLVLGRRGSEEYVKTVVMKRLPRYPEADDTTLMFIQEKAIVEACREPNSWDAALDVIKFAYTRGLPFSYSGFRELTPPTMSRRKSAEVRMNIHKCL